MNDPLTHAYAHLLVDMQLAVFAPAFTVSLCDSEAPANRRLRIASVVRGSYKKKKNRNKKSKHMAIPKYDEIQLPALKLLSDGNELKSNDFV